jgi:hypothetical protein
MFEAAIEAGFPDRVTTDIEPYLSRRLHLVLDPAQEIASVVQILFVLPARRAEPPKLMRCQIIQSPALRVVPQLTVCEALI